MTDLERELLLRSQPIIDFKKTLSVLHEKPRPVCRLGTIAVPALIEWVKNRNLIQEAPAITRGFIGMSEVWLPGDFDGRTSELDALVKPITEQVKQLVTLRVRTPVKVLKAVIDTIDANTCLLPHGDDFFHHSLALRMHVPLITSCDSYGLSFNPKTQDVHAWRMESVGGVYAFNNFEPHTVVKLDTGTRTHLIIDLVVSSLFNGYSREQLHETMRGLGSDNGPFECQNLLTFTDSNLVIRNKLGARYGAPQCSSLKEQLTPQYVEATRAWLSCIARAEVLAGRVQVL